MDIELFNYIDTLFMENRAGRMTTNNLLAAGEKRNLEDPIFNVEEEEPPKLKGIKINASKVFLQMKNSPSGHKFRRDNQDFINNFFINIVARSFTDIEKKIKESDETAK